MDKIDSFLFSLTDEEKARLIEKMQSPKKRRSSLSPVSPLVEQFPSAMVDDASSSSLSSNSLSSSHPLSPNRERKEGMMPTISVDPFEIPDFKALIKSHEVMFVRLIKDKVHSFQLSKKLKEDFIDKGIVPKSLQQNFKISLPNTSISNILKRELKELDLRHQTECLKILQRAREQEGKDLAEKNSFD